MSEANKQVVRRCFEEAMNKGKFDLLDDLVGEEWVDHDPNNPPDAMGGPEGLKQLMGLYKGAFSDLVMTIEEQVAEGDLVASRWTAKGTHDGELMGIEPTGNPVSVSGIFIDRVVEGKLVESWAEWDAAGMMRQVGAA